MPLYNNKVLKEKDAKARALEHEAKKIDAGFSKNLKNFEKNQNETKTAFRMDPLLAQITGQSSLQEEKNKTEVEKKTLEKLKEVEENAYKEAYELGKKEGIEQGIQEAKELVEEKIANLENQINTIANMQPAMMEHNEAKIMEMIFKIASRIAMKEIKEDDGYIVGLLKKLASGIQQEMESSVRISQGDYDFLQEMGEKFQREIRIPKNAVLEPDKTLEHGECRVETNYGVVDASIEARIEKLWSSIKDTIPKSFSEGA